MYVADRTNNRIRKVTVSTGIITTIAGSSTSTDYSGDGGQATSAKLYNPTEVVLDSSGTHSFPLLHYQLVPFDIILFSIKATCTSLIWVIVVSAR